jgi:hypothetical protein
MREREMKEREEERCDARNRYERDVMGEKERVSVRYERDARER